MRGNEPRLRVAILTSRNATGIESLISDPRRGTVYEIAGVVSSEPELRNAAVIEAARVPLLSIPFARFHEERGLPPRNLRARRQYDEELAATLQRLGADYVLLVGYRYIVTSPLLEAFPNSVIALHETDLTQQRDRGLHAVADALYTGAPETRVSAWIVTEEVAAGPLLLLSGAYRVPPVVDDARRWGAADLLRSYSDIHAQWMMRRASGPMLVRLVEILAGGTLQIVGDVVWVDGAPGPCRMGEAPALCLEEEPAGIPRSCPFISSH
ncbi:MAG TPA: formyltransferase family protein [Thermoanaerobaculia bacterium]|nr:formyltransferase family protein [Thermoanaerobaculia bacterium]